MRDLDIYRRVGADFRRTWPSLLATDLLYKLVPFVVLAPVATLIVRWALTRSGRTVAADQDLAAFFLSPVGLLALLVILVVSVGAIALEQAALMAIAWGAVRGRRVRPRDALAFTLGKALPVLRLVFVIIVRCLLLVAPLLLVVGGLYLALLRDYDINYYLTYKPPAFRTVAIVAVVLGAATLFFVGRRLLGWAYALPLVLFENRSPRAALDESRVRAARNRRRIGRTLASWLLFWTVLAAVVTAVVGGITGWLVPRFSHSLPLLATVVGIALSITGAVNFVLGFLQSTSFALLITRLYAQFGEPAAVDEVVEGVGDELVTMATGWRLPRGVGLAAILLASVAVAFFGWWLLHDASVEDDVVIIAHRGAAGSAPENTLASVERALDDGTDWVEIDVQETADGEVAVIHDRDFMKIAGVNLKIWDATREDLARIDVGSWYAAEFSDQRVPLLAEVLEACRDRAGVVIELKYYGHDERLAERVAEIVEATGMTDRVMAMSLELRQVEQMKRLRPDWIVGLLTATVLGDLTRMEADFLAVNTSLATPGFVRRAHRSGKQVYVWTVNDAAAMSAMISHGVDGLITDHPALARRVLDQRAEMSTAERLLVNLGFWLDELDEAPATLEES